MHVIWTNLFERHHSRPKWTLTMCESMVISPVHCLVSGCPPGEVPLSMGKIWVFALSQGREGSSSVENNNISSLVGLKNLLEDFVFVYIPHNHFRLSSAHKNTVLSVIASVVIFRSSGLPPRSLSSLSS